LDGAAELLAKTIVTTVLFSSAVVMMILPVQRLLIEILFVRGQFSSSDAQAVSDVLVCQIPWVLACAVTGSLTSYLYIERSYARVAVAALVGLAVTFLASYLLQPVIPLTAVPIASSAGASMTLGWVFYLVVKSPVWPNLKVRLGSYLPLMTVSCSAMGLSYTLEGIAHLMSLSDYLLADLLMGAMFAVFVLLIRFSKSLRTQCRTAMGGQL
jgi:peptidoglycan biosynthesis protein MviN/MurJ (putative lipid II flippase)